MPTSYLKMTHEMTHQIDGLPLAKLAARKPDSHKGDFGRALLIGGSRPMSGAVAMAALASLRSGAGLVTAGVPEPCLETVASFHPSYMCAPLPADEDGRISREALEPIQSLAQRADCVACGPGLGQSADLEWLVGILYSALDCPLVLDADALNVLAKGWKDLPHSSGPRILTPHPGEFARLWQGAGGAPFRSGEDPDKRAEMEQAAVSFAADHQVIVVLKGHRTLISDGGRTTHNATGNPGMATGGSGDVLTGVITALVCQKLEGFDAAVLGVHIHGLAGDLAAAEKGQVGLVATDLIDFLPQAFLR